MTPQRVLFAGGGTAGHLTPCLAVAETLLEDSPNVQVAFIVSRRPADAAMLTTRHLSHYPILGTGMPYGISPSAIISLAQLGLGCLQAMNIIRKLRPQLLFATGGFISAAAVLAAHVLRVPVMLHVSDAMADRTNRRLARWADVMSVVSKETVDQLKARRVIVTGQPVRPEVLHADPLQARQILGIPSSAFVVLITGGSQGAETLNRAVAGALPSLLGEPDLHLIHLTGTGKLPDHSQLSAQRLPLNRYLVDERREDMAVVLAACDVVVTRAGASSLAEASVWGRPMIVVPYPHAGGHQRHNAELYRQAGAAWVVDDAEFDSEKLTGLITRLRLEPATYRTMSHAALETGAKQAADKITGLIRTFLPPPTTTHF
jgi:UDP-N-acetylglucosamine--N-acetylmuramyl-(pentapeptide) pyrophosphoryl-undecaprenol N-acetylglucosamine transferase